MDAPLTSREIFDAYGTQLVRIGTELEAIGDLLTLAIINPDDIGRREGLERQRGLERMLERLQDRLITRALKQIELDQRGEQR